MAASESSTVRASFLAAASFASLSSLNSLAVARARANLQIGLDANVVEANAKGSAAQ